MVALFSGCIHFVNYVNYSTHCCLRKESDQGQQFINKNDVC